MDPNNEERRIMGLHVSLGVGNPDMGSYLRLPPPSPVADADADAEADADADDAGGPPGNINPIRPIAPSFDSEGLYWCEECRNLTQGSQWRRSRITGLRDICNSHYQRRRYRERRNAPNRVVDA